MYGCTQILSYILSLLLSVTVKRYRQTERGGSYKYSEHMGGGCEKIRSLDYPWLCMKFEVG